MELGVELCGKLIPQCGILVVKDYPSDIPPKVPGVLGMNVIKKCYTALFGQHWLTLFDSSILSEAPKPVFQALQDCP